MIEDLLERAYEFLDEATTRRQLRDRLQDSGRGAIPISRAFKRGNPNLGVNLVTSSEARESSRFRQQGLNPDDNRSNYPFFMRRHASYSSPLGTNRNSRREWKSRDSFHRFLRSGRDVPWSERED